MTSIIEGLLVGQGGLEESLDLVGKGGLEEGIGIGGVGLLEDTAMFITGHQNEVLGDVREFDLVGGALAVVETADEVGVAVLEELGPAPLGLDETLDVDLGQRGPAGRMQDPEFSSGLLYHHLHLIGEVGGTGHLGLALHQQLQVVLSELFWDAQGGHSLRGTVEGHLVVGQQQHEVLLFGIVREHERVDAEEHLQVHLVEEELESAGARVADLHLVSF